MEAKQYLIVYIYGHFSYLVIVWSHCSWMSKGLLYISWQNVQLQDVYNPVICSTLCFSSVPNSTCPCTSYTITVSWVIID